MQSTLDSQKKPVNRFLPFAAKVIIDRVMVPDGFQLETFSPIDPYALWIYDMCGDNKWFYINKQTHCRW